MSFDSDVPGAAVMAQSKFSIAEHAMFLAGYMDAVGRVLSTDEEIISFSSSLLAAADVAEEIQGFKVAEVLDRNWSREFGSLLKDRFGLDPRSRLGFYLLDYIGWFQCFSGNVECVSVVRSCSPDVVFEAAYALRWNDGAQVLLLFARIRKASPGCSFTLKTVLSPSLESKS